MTSPILRRQYVDGRFGQLHVRRADPPAGVISRHPPLLLFHMSPYSGVIWDNFLPAMAADRTVIAVDTPGFGSSDAPPAPPAIADYAAAMGDLIDALKLRPVDVMGYHTGSKIALELARQRGTQVRRIVMVSAAIWTDEELAEHRATFAKSDLTTDGSHLANSWQSVQRWSMKGRTLEQMAETFHAKLMRPAISWWGHNAAFNYSTTDALKALEHEILILNPEDDIWAFTPRAKQYLKRGRIVDLPGWSHGFLDVKTAEAAKIVREFLDAHP
ncbi:MAG: alpha/beta hydrolase [Rhodobacteraceae bacterium]|nr:alpha/beta hydrolase [Paracoccaceae bacterium]